MIIDYACVRWTASLLSKLDVMYAILWTGFEKKTS